ncbi:UDP-glucose 4-epimerase GalE [Edaphobacter sp. DSM 109919]|uniref:UDP-glucose 4-epimerase n=1 Tax=Edaphobacter paludis TaxID=3035702 RepID=A0AAU7D0W4_9BACT
MRVLLVGGAGYIGSHVALRLSERGFVPVIYDNFSTGHRRFVDQFEVIQGEMADCECLRHALKNIDAVIHFAAKAYVGESILKPREYYTTNMTDALTLLNATVDAGIRKFIFSSSCAVYGVPEQLPIRETTPRIPINPYGQTKAAFEDALRSYSAAYGLRFVALRYFNAAGADESGTLGEMRSTETHLIPLVLKAALRRSQQVNIFGNDYTTPDGTCIRDYIHVNDLASAHVSALELLFNEGESDVFNLGTGVGFSVLEVIAAAEKVSSLRVPRAILPRRTGDPPILVCDGEHARRKLHWSPQRGLIEILRTAWKWQIANQADDLLSTPLRQSSAQHRPLSIYHAQDAYQSAGRQSVSDKGASR